MNALFWILGATFINGLVALVGIFSLGLKEGSFKKMIFLLVAFSAGALLSGALFHLIPHALEESSANLVFPIVLFGFILFFLLERFLYWHHCHEGHCETHPVSYLMIIGDAVHNFVDGFIIGVSFVVNVPLGLITTLVIIGHEIPQELGDFAVMVHGGFGRKKALLYNFLSQLTAIIGGVFAYFFSTSFEAPVHLMIPFAAGGFIYIAASDLIPELHKEPDKKRSLWSFGFFLLGILLMILLKIFLVH